MDYLWQIHYQFTWTGLLGLTIKLALLYFALHLAKQGSQRITAPAPWQLKLKKIIHYISLVFEPAVLLIISSYFALIHPFYHGLILLLLVLTNFSHLRNYFSGRIILFDSSLHVGSRLSSVKRIDGDAFAKGIITKIGRLGIYIQTDKGLQVVSYNNLSQQTYNLLDREETGGFFRLKVGLQAEEKEELAHKQLMHLLNVSPYINWNHQPDVKQIERLKNNQWAAHLALHHEQHLYDLMELLEERGFSCQIAKL